ncbi:MAG: hypothetical protein ACR2F1_05565 [Nitrososphaeraceae archaeon]
MSYDGPDDKNKENITNDLDNIKRQLLADQQKYLEEKQKQSVINDTNNNNDNKLIIDEHKLKFQIHNEDIFEYVIKKVKNTVKCEDVLIRQILYTGFSAYIENDPLNLGILAPTSEGKTYPIIESLQYFPDDDVIYIGQMSTMTLVRQRGVKVDKNNQPIDNKIQELKEKIRELTKKKIQTKDEEEKAEVNEEIEKYNEEIEKYNEEIQKLNKESKTLIDLSGKILVFLEPPKHELFNLLKPILSHDKKEIEFPFVNKTDRYGHETKTVAVRGWPACIFCSAKDESKWDIWPEIKSRILTTSPNMNPHKYKESIELISLKAGEPNLIQQEMIISDEEIETTKSCVSYIKQKIKELKIKNEDKKISTWIPYRHVLEKELPSSKGPDMRFAKRVYTLLNIVPIVKYNLRKILVFNDETSVIADLDDLREVLSITQNFDGIPKYKIVFFNNIFYSLFTSKNGRPDENKDGSKKEDIPAVTARQLCDKYKEIMGKTISIDILKKTYLNELINNGIIDYDTSKIDAKQYIYYPLVESYSLESNNEENSLSFLSKSTHFDNISQLSLSIYEKIIKNISEAWIFSEIIKKLCYRNNISNIVGPLADNLNDTPDLQIWDNSIVTSSKLRQQHKEEGDKNNIKNNCCSCNSIEDRKGRLTIREFTKKYIEISKNHFDNKRNSNIVHFGKITPIISNLHNFDNKDITNKNIESEKDSQCSPNTVRTIIDIPEEQKQLQQNRLFNNPLISKSDLAIGNYDPKIINSINRIKGTDRWFCKNCTMKEDKWFMMKHHCKNNNNKE